MVEFRVGLRGAHGIVPHRAAAKSNQVKSLDWRARRAALVCRLPRDTVRDVLATLGTLLGEKEA
jgi:mRNA-degrading endonuclease toxin of MazEF toxin-antitoxin module